jgi:hypothetical protein
MLLTMFASTPVLPCSSWLAARSADVSLGDILGMGILLFMFVGLPLIAWWFDDDRRMRNRLRRAPPRGIDTLTTTEAGRVLGVAQPLEEPFVAPLSGRRCVYYRARVEQKKGNNRAVLIDEVKGSPFALHDGSARALVDPQSAYMLLVEHLSQRSGGIVHGRPEPAEAAFLRRHRKHHQDSGILPRRLRYREEAIEVGETIAVLGRRDRHREAEQHLPRIERFGAVPLVISDELLWRRGR